MLAKTNIPITLGQGIDTKTDEKLVAPGKLLELENGVFNKFGTLSKRKGYKVLPQVTLIGENITKASALGNFQNEINLYTGQKLYAFTESSQKWVDKGNVVSIVAEAQQIVTNSSEQLLPSVNTNSGLTVYAYQEGTDVKYTVLDQATGTKIVHNKLLDGDLIKPKVLPLGTNMLVVIAVDTSTDSLKYYAISIADPANIMASGTISASINTTDPTYDADSDKAHIFVAYNNTSDEVELAKMDQNLAVTDIETIDTDDGSKCIAVHIDDQSRVWVAARDAAELRVMVSSYNLTTLLAPTTLDTDTTFPTRNVTLTVEGDTAHVYFEKEGAQAWQHFIDYNTMTLAGTAGTTSLLVRSCGLAGQVFVQDGIRYLAGVHQSPLQSSYFILNQDREVIARLSYGTGGNLINAAPLSQLPRLDDNTLLFVSSVKGKLEAEGGDLFTRLGVNSHTLDFSNNNRFQNLEMSNLYITGACPQMYDGVKIVEEGFNLFPEHGAATQTTQSGGGLTLGTYQTATIYEWTDSLGRIHRSAPMIRSIELTGGSNAISMLVNSLKMTQKENVRIVTYRTEVNGSIFYRASSVSAAIINDPTINSHNYFLLDSDAVIVGRDQLYTTGGVLENDPAPASSLIIGYKNRIFLSGLEDPNKIVYSKQVITNEAPEFTSFFSINVDAKGGKITALGVMDNYLVIFKNSSIFVLVGEGPDDLGNNNDFFSPQLVTTDVGCNNPNSVVETPVGLMFKSAKGIHMLDRSLNVQYIGAEVEKYNDSLITASQLLSDQNQVRFTTNTDLALVYDYFAGQWSTFTNHKAEDCIVFQNKFTFIRPNGEVWQETDQYLDNGSPIQLRLTTSWFSFGNLQGFKRVYGMKFLGKYKGPHLLQVRVAQDFNPAFVQDVTIDPGDLLNIAAYGSGNFGTGTFGGEEAVYQFDVKTKRQKCQSIQFQIVDLPEAGSEGFEISNLAFEVGIKRGQMKLKKGNKTVGLG